MAAWQESLMQPVNLLAALQMKNQRDGSAGDSTYERLMKQEALKQEQLKSLLAQQQYEQQTSVPTITVPGVMASGGSMGGAYKVPITDLPGQVSGQAAPTYGQQVHEGNMQTGKLMASMGEAAASANDIGGGSSALARALRGGGNKGVVPTTESAPNAWNGYGQYPLEAMGVKDLLAQAAMTKATGVRPVQNITDPKINYDPNAVAAAQQYQADNQGMPYNSPNDVKNVSDINKANATMLKGQAQAAEKAKREAAKIASAQAKESSKVQDVATRQSRVAELGKTLSGDPEADKKTLADMAKIAKVTVSELINSEMYRNLMKK